LLTEMIQSLKVQPIPYPQLYLNEKVSPVHTKGLMKRIVRMIVH